MKFSVGICAYNEEKNIGHLLKNLIGQATEHELGEIIVVSSGSTDKTDEIVKEWQKRDNRVHLITESERYGKWSAVNQVFKNFQHEILVMTDADCLLRKGALDLLLSRFKDEVGAVVGRTVPINVKSSFWGYAAHLRYQLFHLGALIEADRGRFCHLSGYLYGVRRGIVEEIPPLICDDLYVGVAVKNSRYKVTYEPNAGVWIKHPTNLKDFLNQRTNIRLGHLQIHRLTRHRPSSTVPLHTIPLVLVAWRTLGPGWRELFYTFLVAVLEQYAAFSAYIKFRLRRVPVKWKYISSSKELKL